jgi:hypothetical protein
MTRWARAPAFTVASVSNPFDVILYIPVFTYTTCTMSLDTLLLLMVS